MQIYSLFFTQWNKVYIKLKRSKIKETASAAKEFNPPARKVVVMVTLL